MGFYNLLFLVGCLALALNASPDETKAKTELMKDYDRDARPVVEYGDVVNLTYGAGLYQFMGLDIERESMTVVFWQRLSWVDESLKWNPEDYNGVEVIRVKQDEIWVPDLLPYNEMGLFNPKLYDKLPLNVNSSGVVQWLVPLTLETSCPLDVTEFPYDKQQCFIEIGSWQYTGLEVDINCDSLGAFDVSNYTGHSQWELLETSCERNPNLLNGISYPTIFYTVKFARLNTFYIRNLILPNAFLLALSSLTIFIPTNCGERMGYGVTIFLALCVNLIILTDYVPQTSATFPRIFNYFISSMFIAALGLLYGALSLNVYSWWEKRKAHLEEIAEHKRQNRSEQKATEEVDEDEMNPGWTVFDHFLENNLDHIDQVLGTIYFIFTTFFTIGYILSMGD